MELNSKTRKRLEEEAMVIAEKIRKSIYDMWVQSRKSSRLDFGHASYQSFVRDAIKKEWAAFAAPYVERAQQAKADADKCAESAEIFRKRAEAAEKALADQVNCTAQLESNICFLNERLDKASQAEARVVCKNCGLRIYQDEQPIAIGLRRAWRHHGSNFIECGGELDTSAEPGNQPKEEGQLSNEKQLCELCGEPMSEGEEMFKYHGYSGPCPSTHHDMEAVLEASATAGVGLEVRESAPVDFYPVEIKGRKVCPMCAKPVIEEVREIKWPELRTSGYGQSAHYDEGYNKARAECIAAYNAARRSPAPGMDEIKKAWAELRIHIWESDFDESDYEHTDYTRAVMALDAALASYEPLKPWQAISTKSEQSKGPLASPGTNNDKGDR